MVVGIFIIEKGWKMSKYLICCGRYRKFFSNEEEARKSAKKVSDVTGSCRVLQKLDDGKYKHLCQYYSKG